jgi:hypothetical protein
MGAQAVLGNCSICIAWAMMILLQNIQISPYDWFFVGWVWTHQR